MIDELRYRVFYLEILGDAVGDHARGHGRRGAGGESDCRRESGRRAQSCARRADHHRTDMRQALATGTTRTAAPALSPQLRR